MVVAISTFFWGEVCSVFISCDSCRSRRSLVEQTVEAARECKGLCHVPPEGYGLDKVTFDMVLDAPRTTWSLVRRVGKPGSGIFLVLVELIRHD